MKHFIKSVLWFIPFLITAYLLLIFVWGRFVPQLFKPNLNYKTGSSGHTFSRLQEVKNINGLDILFLGSSHAYRGFDTRLFGENNLKTFNLGTSAQTPVETRLLLKRYLDQLDPALIIYEVYPKTFSIDGAESALNIIADDKNDFNSINMALNINNVKVYNTLMYGFMSDWFNLNASFVEPAQIGKDKYIPGGYVEREQSYFKYVTHSQSQWKLNEKQFNSFEEILSMIKKRNIKLILVNSPITSSLYNSYTNNNSFDSIMNTYGEYYNFNTILDLNDSLHFYNSHHLNQEGVKIFNSKLLEIIGKK